MRGIDHSPPQPRVEQMIKIYINDILMFYNGDEKGGGGGAAPGNLPRLPHAERADSLYLNIKTISYRFTMSCLILFFTLILSTPLYSFPEQKLNKTIADFERMHSQSAVIIMNVESAEIDYVYNPEWALRKRFPPGSIAKVWSAVVLLEHASAMGFNPGIRVSCRGRFFPDLSLAFTRSDVKVFNLPFDREAGKRYFRCALKRGHGTVSIREALVHSCNVFFITAAGENHRLFPELLEKTWHLAGNTGARLRSVKELPNIMNAKPSPFQAAASAIGEGGLLRVSPLKVAQTFCALFKGSPLLSPFQPPYRGTRRQYPLRISSDTRNRLKNLLAQALHSGTLRRMKVDHDRVQIIAGKTGTGTHFRKRYATHGWSVVYFKYKRKRHVMVVFVNKGSGSREALDLAMRIANVF